ncbi:MAG: hypothetical protein AAFR56_20885 [Chloroflexota bacterium]
MQSEPVEINSSQHEITFCLHDHETGTYYRATVGRRRLKLTDDGEYTASTRLQGYPHHPTVSVYFNSQMEITRAYVSRDQETMRCEVVPCEAFAAHWNDRLMDVLGFTDADYKANATGTITDPQYDIMYDRIRQSNRALCAVACVLVLLAIIFALTVRLETNIPYWFFAVGFAPLFVFLFFGEVRAGFAVRRAMRLEQLDRVTGRARLFMQTSRSKNGRTVRSYGMWVGRKRFDNLSPEVHAAFISGESYDIHWLPGTHRLMSVKLMESHQTDATAGDFSRIIKT